MRVDRLGGIVAAEATLTLRMRVAPWFTSSTSSARVISKRRRKPLIRTSCTRTSRLCCRYAMVPNQPGGLVAAGDFKRFYMEAGRATRNYAQRHAGNPRALGHSPSQASAGTACSCHHACRKRLESRQILCRLFFGHKKFSFNVVDIRYRQGTCQVVTCRNGVVSPAS